MRSLLAALLIFTAIASAACSVDDGLIDNKKCDPNAPKDRQCVKGYVPVQEQDGCFCRPLSSSSLQTPAPAAQPTVESLDPSRRLLRRLGVLED